MFKDIFLHWAVYLFPFKSDIAEVGETNHTANKIDA